MSGSVSLGRAGNSPHSAGDEIPSHRPDLENRVVRQVREFVPPAAAPNTSQSSTDEILGSSRASSGEILGSSRASSGEILGSSRAPAYEIVPPRDRGNSGSSRRTSDENRGNVLVLSLFPGVGLFDRGFEAEGVPVVRGPDKLWGGDVRSFRPTSGRFDGVIGGPPCQRFSDLHHLALAQGHELAEDLIPEFTRCVAAAAPTWFVMENVPEAPIPAVEGYVVRSHVMDNRWCLGAYHAPGVWVGGEQQRERRISFGTRAGLELSPRFFAAPANPRWAPTVLAAGAGPRRGRGRPSKSIAFVEACRLQGLEPGFDLPGFTTEEKYRAVGNGVPFPLALAIARAVLFAVYGWEPFTSAGARDER